MKDTEDLVNKIKIIYEDENVIVLDKPAGLLVHANEKSGEKTLADWVLKHHPEIEGVGDPYYAKVSKGEPGKALTRHGIVHRLDRDTSGVMIVAKNKIAHEYLKKQFQNRGISKVYKAIVYGKMLKDDGMIETPIGMSASRFGLRSTHKPVGTVREATTYYKVLEHFPEHAYLELRPRTGRTHQLRVHLLSVGNPIVCDKLYAPKRVCLPEIGRLALHASELEVELSEGTKMRFEAAMPDDFERALAKLRSLC